jgi:hypothetical protein
VQWVDVTWPGSSLLLLLRLHLLFFSDEGGGGNGDGTSVVFGIRISRFRLISRGSTRVVVATVAGLVVVASNGRLGRRVSRAGGGRAVATTWSRRGVVRRTRRGVVRRLTVVVIAVTTVVVAAIAIFVMIIVTSTFARAFAGGFASTGLRVLFARLASLSAVVVMTALVVDINVVAPLALQPAIVTVAQRLFLEDFGAGARQADACWAAAVFAVVVAVAFVLGFSFNINASFGIGVGLGEHGLDCLPLEGRFLLELDGLDGGAQEAN